MDNLRQYFISITVCAILCSVITGFLEKKDSSYQIIKMICGIVLTFTVIYPLANVQLKDISIIMNPVTDKVESVITAGEFYMKESMASIIKKETEAYILDKAHGLSCTLDIEVIVDKSDPPVPIEVYITGNLPVSAKKTLQEMIERDLNIPKENQIWIQ